MFVPCKPLQPGLMFKDKFFLVLRIQPTHLRFMGWAFPYPTTQLKPDETLVLAVHLEIWISTVEFWILVSVFQFHAWTLATHMATDTFLCYDRLTFDGIHCNLPSTQESTVKATSSFKSLSPWKTALARAASSRRRLEQHVPPLHQRTGAYFIDQT